MKNTPEYWDDRYRAGVGAGNGSRGRLYLFKVNTVQSIVDEYGVESVVDVGCGDGGQLSELRVKKYTGLDISPTAIDIASRLSDKGRHYFIMNEDSTAKGKTHDMAVSLDVVFHLPDDQYQAHLDLLFRLARRYVLIYSPNHDGSGIRLAPHMHFHRFVDDIKEKYGLDPILHVPQPYPVGNQPANNTSYSEFYLFELTKERSKDEQSEKGGAEHS